MVFKIISKDKSTKARTGILKTKSGSIETPFFMPVATKSSVKHISSHDLDTMNAKAVISNAFVLSLKPGVDIIKKFGGIGKFNSYKGIIFTDSGGFQMYSKQLYLGSKENGVEFRNPFNGDKLFITPEKDMEIQIGLNSDVALCLDTMPLIHESKESIKEAVRKTTLWAEICKKHHDKLQKKRKKEKRQLLFGIIQGGVHDDLRKLSAEEITNIDFDGFAIGGLALGEPKKDEYRMIEIAKKFIPEKRSVYLMGAGNPPELIEAIARGVDMFDSRFPTQNARRGTLFTSFGYMRITNSTHKDTNEPIDKNCNCFVCKNYSRAFIRHMLKMQEGTGFRLASYHNLYFLQDLMKRAREAIKKGKFKEFRKKIAKDFERTKPKTSRKIYKP